MSYVPSARVVPVPTTSGAVSHDQIGTDRRSAYRRADRAGEVDTPVERDCRSADRNADGLSSRVGGSRRGEGEEQDPEHDRAPHCRESDGSNGRKLGRFQNVAIAIAMPAPLNVACAMKPGQTLSHRQRTQARPAPKKTSGGRVPPGFRGPTRRGSPFLRSRPRAREPKDAHTEAAEEELLGEGADQDDYECIRDECRPAALIHSSGARPCSSPPWRNGSSAAEMTKAPSGRRVRPDVRRGKLRNPSAPAGSSRNPSRRFPKRARRASRRRSCRRPRSRSGRNGDALVVRSRAGPAAEGEEHQERREAEPRGERARGLRPGRGLARSRRRCRLHPHSLRRRGAGPRRCPRPRVARR